MIGRGTVWRLGFGQLISWGVTYYLVGVLGPRMAADLGWSLVAVQGGFAAALLVMGLTSSLVGRAIERHGGAKIMTAGALLGALNSAMSAHMIGLLAGLGLGLSAAVWTSALRGFGQTAARGCEVMWGASLKAVDVNLLAAALLPAGFALALWSGASLTAAIGFVLLFGAGNGLSTITRGTLPLAFFDPATYGSSSAA